MDNDNRTPVDKWLIQWNIKLKWIISDMAVVLKTSLAVQRDIKAYNNEN